MGKQWLIGLFFPALLTSAASIALAQTDFDGDGVSDCTDANLLSSAILSVNNDPLFDVNGDTLVNLDDLFEWLFDAGVQNTQIPYSYGDMNLDGEVDGADFTIWEQNRFTALAGYCNGDVDVNGLIDVRDILVWEYFLSNCCGPPAVPPVVSGAGGQAGDEIPEVVYDAQTGLLTINVDFSGLVGLIIEGPDGSNAGLDWEDGSWSPWNVTWTQAYIDGREQWYKVSRLTGTHLYYLEFVIADHGPGLTAADFGDVLVIRLGPGTPVVQTNVIVVNGSTLGDFNLDGHWNCLDVNALSSEFAAGTNIPLFDLNVDGLVSLLDLFVWLDIAGANNPAVTGGNAFLYGDANLDGVVDGYDFLIWNQNKLTANANYCEGNFSGDDVIDTLDFNVWFVNRFQASQ